MANSGKTAYYSIINTNKLLLFAAAIALVGLLYGWYNRDPAPTYAIYQQNKQMYRVPINSVDRPIMSRQAMLNLLSVAVTSAFTFDANNYRAVLPAVGKKYFTDDGAENFLNAMVQAGQTALVVKKQLIVSSVISNRPVILQEGFVAGDYSWRVQMPVIVTYQSASEVFQVHLFVTLIVQKVSTRDNPYGVAIDKFLTQKQ